MKQKLIWIICCTMIVGLIGCGNSKIETTNDNSTNIEVKEENDKNDVKEPPVTIDQLPISITINEPDSIGTVYMDATFTNNSNKNITGYSITVLLKDSNEKTYLSTYDTVLPGETSPIFNTFGPKTQNENDIEFLSYDITITNDDGTNTYLTYDNKLKQYRW